MNIERIKEYAKECKPYFNALNKKQQEQFIISLPLNKEEFIYFFKTLLTSDSFDIRTNIQDMFSCKNNETSNCQLVR